MNSQPKNKKYLFSIPFLVVCLIYTAGCNFNLQKPFDDITLDDSNSDVDLLKAEPDFKLIKERVFDVSCKDCHTNGGSRGGVNYDSYTNTKKFLTETRAEVFGGTMPPTTPSNTLTISKNQKDVLISWLDRGAPEFSNIIPEPEPAPAPAPAPQPPIEPAPAPQPEPPISTEPTPQPTPQLPDEEVAAPLPGEVVRFAQVKKFVFEVSCKNCHLDGKKKGGIALDTHALAFRDLELIRQAVNLGEMPPREPLTTDQKRILMDWISQGAAE